MHLLSPTPRLRERQGLDIQGQEHFSPALAGLLTPLPGCAVYCALGKGEVQDLLRKQDNQILNDSPHGHECGGAPLGINDGDMPVAIDTHPA